jgi:diguanylate cyclase (GGDEF)-like protein
MVGSETGSGPLDAKTEKRTRRARGSFLVDGRGVVLGFDAGMEDLTGRAAVQVVGRHKDAADPASQMETPGQFAASPPLYEGAVGIPAESEVQDLILYGHDGRAIYVEARVSRLSGSGERVAVEILDVLARSEGALGRERLGGQDAVTGLPDRTALLFKLTEQFRRARALAKPLALVLADVDHMRRINDRFGRKAGDEVLRKLAGIFRAEVEDEEMLGRLGDDEFAMILPGTGRQRAREIAGRVRAIVERFRFLEAASDEPPRVSLSLGSASYPADAETEVDLLERSRDALAEARVHGRNRVWCYTRRPRLPVRTPVFFDGEEPLLVGVLRDLSPSGMFVQTPTPLGPGMRCALAFPLPGSQTSVHVIGRVVRAIPPRPLGGPIDGPPAGMAIEFEKFGSEDRTAIEGFLHENERLLYRAERSA